MPRRFECEFFTGLTLKIVRVPGDWNAQFLMGSNLNLVPDEQAKKPRFWH